MFTAVALEMHHGFNTVWCMRNGHEILPYKHEKTSGIFYKNRRALEVEISKRDSIGCYCVADRSYYAQTLSRLLPVVRENHCDYISSYFEPHSSLGTRVRGLQGSTHFFSGTCFTFWYRGVDNEGIPASRRLIYIYIYTAL